MSTKSRLLTLILASTLVVGVFTPIAALAGTLIYVDDTGTADEVAGGGSCGTDPDYSTIQAAVVAASAGDTVFVCAGTYTAPDADGIQIVESITIEGAGEGSVTVRPNQNHGTVFDVGGGTQTPTVTITDLTIDGDSGLSAGQGACQAIYVDEGSDLTVDTVTVQDSLCLPEFLYGGAGALVLTGATLTVIDSEFFRNTVEDGAGGAILAYEADLTITDSLFSENAVRGGDGFNDTVGGAIAMFDTEDDGDPGTPEELAVRTLDITDTQFLVNDAEALATPGGLTGGLGGAIYAEETDVTVLGAPTSGESFTENQAHLAGGAIWLDGTSSLELGWDPAKDLGSTSIPDCPLFASNFTYGQDADDPVETKGGAVFADGDVHLGCTWFNSNGHFGAMEPTTDGGAIYATASIEADPAQPMADDPLVFRPVWFVDNEAARDGGAIAVASTAAADVDLTGTSVDPEALLFLGNLAGRDGGAVAVSQDPAAPSTGIAGISHAAFYRNVAGLDGDGAGGGGAIRVGDDVDLTLSGAAWFGWPYVGTYTVPHVPPPIYLYGATGGYWVGEYLEDPSNSFAGGSGNVAGCSNGMASCSVNSAGGGAILLESSVGTLTVGSSAGSCPGFRHNATKPRTADPDLNRGGAIRVATVGVGGATTVTMDCGKFLENAAFQGGAMYFSGDTTVEMQLVTVADNDAYQAGGGIRSEAVAGSLRILFSTFDGNATEASTGGGAGVYADGALEVISSTLSSNRSSGVGGAIAGAGPSTVLVAGSLFASNEAAQQGGAIFANAALDVVNSTFSGNVINAPGAAGYPGIAAYANDGIALTHVTVGPQAAGLGNDGSWLVVDDGTLSLTNSLVVESGAPGSRCVATTKVDDGGNVATAGCTGFATDPTSSVRTAAEIDLQTLAANGGPTNTFALGATSAAIDVGDDAGEGFDQRGLPRPYDAGSPHPFDAGAYEAAYTVTTTEVTSGGAPVTNVAVGEKVDDTATVAGYFALEGGGSLSPTGAVSFSYCFDPTVVPTSWAACVAADDDVLITEVALSEIADGTGVETASVSDDTDFADGWDPAAVGDGGDGEGAGCYLFHATYVPMGETVYLGSEDDGTDESFCYDVEGIETTTTTRVSRSAISFGQSIRDVATVAASEGTVDPTGTVDFSSCWYADGTEPVDWATCLEDEGSDPNSATISTIGTALLAGGSDTTDATSSAQSGLWSPPNAGDYLLHASYSGDDDFAASEDDGTNERVSVSPAVTLIDLTSQTYFPTVPGSASTLAATLYAPTGCLADRVVTFARDVDGDGTYETPVGTGTTDASGVATTTLSLVAGIYELEVSVGSTSNCSDAVNTATLIVAGTGDSASGGGHYTKSGRINFGFTVQVNTNRKTGAIIVSGQMTWHKQGGRRLKGSITGYTKLTACPSTLVTDATPTCALITGTASYYRWDGGARRWILETTGVGFRITVADGGTVKVCLKKKCTTTTKPDWFAIVVPSLTIDGEADLVLDEKTSEYEPVLLSLKGGSIVLR